MRSVVGKARRGALLRVPTGGALGLAFRRGQQGRPLIFGSWETRLSDGLSCRVGFRWGGWPPLIWPPLPWGGWPPAMWPPLSWEAGANPYLPDGTKILTMRGEIAVETIVAGDLAITVHDDGPDVRRVVWTDRRAVAIAGHPDPLLVLPVRILAGAFEAGLPQRDLRLAPHHAVYLDGVLIEALALVNGSTVVQEQTTARVTYNLIELEAHDVLLAEGLPVESFRDTGDPGVDDDRRMTVRHPSFLGAAGATMCAPLVREGEMLEAARARLLARAEALGFIEGEMVGLIVRVDGKPIWPVANDEVLSFVLPVDAVTAELVSAAYVPAEVTPGATDTRRLGVAVASLTLVSGGDRIEIDLGDERHRGFHAMEEHGHRWTNGAAVIALPDHQGPAVLEVVTSGQAASWAQARLAAVEDQR